MKTRFLLLALAAAPAWADDAALLRCRAIPEAPARLACYDALVVAPREARPPPRAEPRAVPQQPAAREAPEARVLPPQTPSQFGLEQRVATVELQAIESYIPGRFEGWQPKARIRLGNGQVWQVTDDTSRMVDLTDTRVTLRRGAIGSFFMDFDAIGRTVRVRRVE